MYAAGFQRRERDRICQSEEWLPRLQSSSPWWLAPPILDQAEMLRDEIVNKIEACQVFCYVNSTPYTPFRSALGSPLVFREAPI